ncbi:TerC family protein [Magnetospirillum gryphiswaldense]|uniref:TerC family integral membrane protein n=1 Tax=Magnetospirillum gryphiswaldense TaxID=55518 RepID=A4U0M6_9PROT|nr:TerC family protein [Magnetospirillum gryphiswaldense]CAM76433.1 TerC family integral membrane protein [Magnetospirillum gryphiswaldense MSR-1]
MMEWLSDPQLWISLLTLAALEIVLGIDNLVFLTILSDRLPEAQRPLARKLGLAFALITRLALLASLSWIVGLVDPVFTVWGHAVSWRDIILIGGGLFLLTKATHEIHGSLEGEEDDGHGGAVKAAAAGFAATIIQIGILDIVFSLDSVITAVGMVDQLEVMAAAVIIAVIVMLVAAGPLSAFVSAHPTVKMLALSFLLLVGMALIADGLGFHIPKGYLYFAMGFSVLVEALNLIARKRRKPVKLRNSL